MKTVKQVLSLLLVLALLLTCVPAPVLAAEEPRKNHFSGYNDRYGNRGRVENPITESPEVVERPDFSEFPTSFEEAGEVLRAGFVARQEVTQVCIATKNANIEEVFYQIWDEAMAHTGDPVEGDYIWCQWNYYYVEYETEWVEGTWYHAFAVVMNYYSDAQMEAEVTDAVDTLLNETLPLDDSMSDYEKVKIVYDWICSNVDYDYENVDDETYLPQYTAHAALLDGVAVCNGYAVLLYRLLLELGIDCRVITGNAYGPHAWNIVALDGLYYNVDSTWDEDYAQTESPYEWFLLSPDSFVDHEREHPYNTADFDAAYPMAAEDYPGYERPDPVLLTGQCGDDVYWSLDEDGYLSIYGSGPTWDFSNGFPTYFQYVEKIKTCIIEEGVTGLGEWLLTGYYNLEWVEIPASVEYIRDMALSTCRELVNVDFLGSAPEIAEWAFLDTQTDVWYPAGDSSWDGVAGNDFGGDLTWIGFENDEEDEEEWPVSGQCGDDVYWSLDEFGDLTLSGTGPTWDFPDDSPTFFDYSEQIGCCFIEEGVTALGDWLFYNCDSMWWVDIADSVAYIGKEAFGSCDGLTDVDFYGGAPEIDESAFDAVAADVTYPLDDSSWDGVAGYDYGGALNWIGFEGEEEWPVSGQCGNDVTWYLDEDGILILSGTGATWDFFEALPSFYEYVDWIEGCIIEEGVTYLGNWLFYECDSMDWVEIAASVDYIGIDAFGCCDGLYSVEFMGSAPEIDETAFEEVMADVIYLWEDSSWDGVAGNQFGGELNWVDYDPPIYPLTGQCGDDVYWILNDSGSLFIYGTGPMWDDVDEALGWSDYAKRIDSVIIGRGVTGIGDHAFSGCRNMTLAVLSATVDEVGAGAFAKCGTEAVILFTGDAPAFAADCFAGTEAQVGYFGRYTTWTEDIMRDYGGMVQWFDCDADIPAAPPASGQCGDDVYWELDTDGLLTISGTGDMWGWLFDVPEWDSYAYYITDVRICDDVTSVGLMAFWMSVLTKTVRIAESVERIDNAAFAHCVNLEQVIFEGSAPSIAEAAFYGVTADCIYPAEDPTWTEDVQQNYEGYLTWKPGECEELPEVWPLTGQCGDDVYWSLSEDGLLTISGTGRMWDYAAEAGAPWRDACVAITAVTVESGVASIGSSAFSGLDALRTAVLPEGLEIIEDMAFDRCTALTQIQIPESVTSIGMYAFFRCESLTAVTIPAGVRKLEAKVFQSCTALEEIIFLGDAPALGNEVFCNIEATVRYPGDNETWTEEVRQDYGGTITWVPEGGTEDTIDLDGSGSVDSDDAVYLLYHSLFGDALYPVSGDCDFNGDGTVNSDDAIYLLFYVLFGELLYPLK